MTSSARASKVDGTVKPGALAVLRLIYQIVLGWRLDWQVSGLFTLQDAINVTGRSTVLFEWIRAVRDKTHARSVIALAVNGGKLVPGRQCDDQIPMDHGDRACSHD